jgi:hypothetical protein
VKGPDSTHGEFDINGEYVQLRQGENYILANGARLVFHEGIVQPYAGGINGTEFSLEGACPTDQNIRAQFVRSLAGGDYGINGKNVVLKAGESHTNSDGSKLTHHGSLKQDYAGGLHGVQFGLDC